ncbi:hypothetical protein VHEMI00616 [[Torrubiella] hemipterigena]|uniref:ABM domain-containing protein n=1 Tax=[Torrubiella] hemipterigena TaxID=1531966 RepID=A0A0A1T2U5_9HYPO|nr:hypothetical protein VHEMI00616 [[Torrubiella] hemipterigena]
MARIKQTNRKPSVKPLVTWTRFYLPRDHVWPGWDGDHDNIHIGPLRNVVVVRGLKLRRLIDDPEQAAYLIEWEDRESFEAFLSSPACVEFLNNLPEHAAHTEDPGSATVSQLNEMTLSDNPESSLAVKSRFCLCKHTNNRPTAQLEGIITLTVFSVPGTVKEHLASEKLPEPLQQAFSGFYPGGSLVSTYRRYGHATSFSTFWTMVLEEDKCVARKFGTMPLQPAGPSRVIFCHAYSWSYSFEEPREEEAASVRNEAAQKAWQQMIARAMPPATACIQERWHIQRIPVFDSPITKDDPEWEKYEEHEIRIREFLRNHGDHIPFEENEEALIAKYLGSD